MAFDTIHDIIGIGFGPANLAIAIALSERSKDAQPISAMFVESHPHYDWHPGMMLDGSKMQVSFLKDFATMRAPTSQYTFLNYLNTIGRLEAFINKSTFSPSRKEYANYMSWCANKVVQEPNVNVAYGERVSSIEYIEDDQDSPYVGCLKVCSIISNTGETKVRYGRNLIASTGGIPSIPSVFKQSIPSKAICGLDSYVGDKGIQDSPVEPLVMHTAYYMTQIDRLMKRLNQKYSNPTTRPSTGRPIKLAVVGSGQSAAEIFMDLKSKLELLPEDVAKSSKVHMIFRRTNVYPSDDSPFSNEIFDPSMTDFFYGLGSLSVHESERPVGLGRAAVAPPTTTNGNNNGADGERSNGPSYNLMAGFRDRVLKESKATNYSVVNPRTIEALYDAMYDQQVERQSRDDPENMVGQLEMLPFRQIVSAQENGDNTVKLTLRHVYYEDIQEEEYDAIFLGTGYTRQGWRSIVWDNGLSKVFSSTAASSPKECVSNNTPNSSGAATTNSSSRNPSKDRHPYFESTTTTTTSSETSSVFDGGDSGLNSPTTGMTSSFMSSNGMNGGTKKINMDKINNLERDHQSTGSSLDILKEYNNNQDIISREYRLKLPELTAKGTQFKPTVWLQGSNERTHGISDSLLSVLAVRSGEVVRAFEKQAWLVDN